MQWKPDIMQVRLQNYHGKDKHIHTRLQPEHWQDDATMAEM
jgi:hypothetical protein